MHQLILFRWDAEFKNIEDWDIEDPWGKDIQFFRKTRDIIKGKVENLLKKL
ncbi:hypothetical protein ES708_12584 [subsurface metagenome]